MAKDFYELLGVPKNATIGQIKQVYRRLAKRYHPDTSRTSETAAIFREINTAYSVLLDPQKRAVYDRNLNFSQEPPHRAKEKPRDVDAVVREGLKVAREVLERKRREKEATSARDEALIKEALRLAKEHSRKKNLGAYKFRPK
ncbi:MAG: DnaJ domain-containing protein [Candidatus Diapherotrites archaeon]|nr:DnaJ domain-containing protein [Candidatus Diapherotrites archaeon]